MKEDTLAVVPLENSAPAVRAPEELAAEVTRILEVIAEHLQLETPHPSTARCVRGARTVSREFVVSMIAAAERHPDHPILERFDSARARKVLESTDAYRIMAEYTAMFLARLKYTTEVNWAEVVANAMETYALAGIRAKHSKNAVLAAEVANMRQHLRKGGRKSGRKKKETKGEQEE